MIKFITATDFYKTGRKYQMQPGTTRVLLNWTARAGLIEGADSAVFFGLQGHLKYDLTDLAHRTFFSQPRSDVLYDYQKMLDSCLGKYSKVTTDHISALWDLQYLPLEFCAVPEGTRVPYRVPMFTVENTHDDFAWLPSYIEDLSSSRIWLSCTSATTASRYRKMLESWCDKTGGDPSFVDIQGHDFSFRGMSCPEAAAFSGAGHLLSFQGTDTIPALEILHDVYDGGASIGGSIPATEHLIECLGGKDHELEEWDRTLDLYPEGPISKVADTWNLWNVLTNILPRLKDKIMERDGALVVRPDSGDPVLILTGDRSADPLSPEYKGVVELLWDIFGGTRTEAGYKQLDSHVGTIYGDAITYNRAWEILERLEAKGFASTNVVFGIGSYTYQYVTRDTHGFAIKGTWARVNGQEKFLSKDPITDSGTKKSATGRLVVLEKDGVPYLIDGLNFETAERYRISSLLQPIWRNGRFLKRWSLSEVKNNLFHNRIRPTKELRGTKIA